MCRCFSLFTIFFLIYLQCVHSRKIIKLESLNISPKEVTLSGFDSGGAAAASFMISHSSLVSGLALFSSYPYLCGGVGKTIWHRISNCHEKYDIDRVQSLMMIYETMGLVDPLINLAKVPIYAEHGSGDPIISSEIGRAFVDLLKNFTTDVKFSSPYEGHMPLLMRMKGDDSPEVVSSTGFDSVFQGLKYIYRLKKKIIKPQKTKNSECLTLSSGGLQSFVQDEFGGKNSSLAKFGTIYIPPTCQGGKSSNCSLHVVFHGCNEFRHFSQKNFITCSGYINVARMNKMIVLFPKARMEPMFVNGLDLANCWDFFGENKNTYGTKLSSQNEAIYKMITRLLGDNVKSETSKETEEEEEVE